MERKLLREILKILDRTLYSKFIYDLWKSKDASTELKVSKTYFLPHIGESIFEQRIINRLSKKSANENQQYNLIIPFFYPLDLFKRIQGVENDPVLFKSLKKYKRVLDKRQSSWNWPVDGQYFTPNIAFVSNYEGLNEDVYLDKLIPSLQNLLDNLELEGNAVFGSVDSFIETDFETTRDIFIEFLRKKYSNISISFEDEISVERFSSDRYLLGGVLKNSLNPYEPIFLKPQNDKGEIIREFEYLLNRSESESSLEKFLSRYYKEIFGEHYDRIETQIWLKVPDLDFANKNRRLDIFLRNAVENDWELFELKRETKLSKSYRDIPTLSSEIYYAIQQVQNYKRLLVQDKVKKLLACQGIEYFEPEYRLVIGNKPNIPVETWRWLKKTNEKDLKIITYEDLIEEMKYRYNLHNKIDSLK